jgi:hypothetical protein
VLRIVTALSLLLVVSACFAEAFSSLEERMSAREFSEAGLDQLSPEQLAKLNSWLRGQHGVAAASAAPALDSADRRGFFAEDANQESVVSRILGEFRGWRGSGERFELENGQVWQSADPSASLSVKLQNPTVRISPGLFRSWYLKVDGYNASVLVKRIQ